MTTALTGLPRAYSPYGAGSYIRFFDNQTDTPKDVFSDSSLTTPIDNVDLVANAASTFPIIFLSPSLYRIKVFDANNVLKFMVDDYDPGLGAGFGVSSVVGVAQGGTGANNAATARTNIGAASTTAVEAAQDDITELQQQIAPGLNGDNELGTLAARNDITTGQLATGYGSVIVDVVEATPYTANSTLTDAIPLDDTIPLVSEGTQILTASITPKSVSNKIRYFFEGFGTCSGSGTTCIVAVFRGNTCVGVNTGGSNSVTVDLGFSKTDEPNSTSTLTYTVRVGAPAGANGIRMNGTFSARLFGGAASCTLRLEEIEAH